MDKVEELWEANKTKAKKDQLSMRAIAHQLNLPKTTVIERLSERRKGHGHIAGGKRQARVLTKGTQAGHQVGQNNHNHNRNNRTCKRVTKRVRALKVCTTFPPKLLGLFLQFSIDQEDDLEELLTVYARRGFPFSDDQLCTLAYELAARTNRPGFSPTKKKAGRAWRKGFMCRKPHLRKKNAQNLSAARAMAANPVQVDKFFELLKQWVRAWEIEFKPNNMWNVDETGISDVPKERRVIGISGECVFQTVADEKGITTTVVTFVSAGGLHVPPMIIFKAGKVKNIWREAAPSGYTVQRSDSGYINAELFAEYGAKFVDFLKEKNLLGNNQKNLLLLDLHSSHLFNAKSMNMMIENNIEVCSSPPHCTHVLQPLDDVPYAVLKQKYQKELLSYNFSVAGAKMNPIQLFRVHVPAFTQAFSPENIRKGFQQTGIYPIDPTVAKLKDLGPSIITDKCKTINIFITLCFFQICWSF